MTKESPMTNVETCARAAHGLSFGLRHFLVISASSLVVQVLTLIIRAYQLILSPTQTFFFGSMSGCRFTPTCSQFAIEAIQTRGALVGTFLATKRICRCHPWGECGHDPVPKKEFSIFNLGSTESRPTET